MPGDKPPREKSYEQPEKTREPSRKEASQDALAPSLRLVGSSRAGDQTHACAHGGVVVAGHRRRVLAELRRDAGVERAQKLAIEVNGPSHYLRDIDTKTHVEDGRTRFKRRLLELYGWRVVTVDHKEWDGKADEDRMAYLQAKLASQVPPIRPKC